MDEAKKDIICAILTNVKDIIPTLSSYDIISRYIGADIDTEDELNMVNAQQEYIAIWVSSLADKIIEIN